MTDQTGKRPLPLLPNADHLRKQAKARLALMRADLPATRLADAQRLLAQDYGFANWSALQAEVVRRADGPLGRGIRKRRLLATLVAPTAVRLNNQSDDHAPLQFLRGGIVVQISCLVALLAAIGVVCFALYRAGVPFRATQDSSPRIEILHKRI